MNPVSVGRGVLRSLRAAKRAPLVSASSSSVGKVALHNDFRGAAYEESFRRSVEEPEEFWGEIAENTVWTKRWSKVLDQSDPPMIKWFVGGRLSLCYNALDRHVDAGLGGRDAIVWDSPITGSKDKITYAGLQEKVSTMSGVLSSLGVGRGDRVLVYMPMIPEAIVAMLATVRLGAAHSVVFGGFAAKELATRIRHLRPKVILSANCGVEPSRVVSYKPIVDEALRLASAPDSVPVVVFQRPGFERAALAAHRGDADWAEAAAAAEGRRHDCVDVDANDPLYLLYTSGTTGEPKGIQHPTGGHAVVNTWTMKALYGMNPGDVWWAASDLGWIVGHEYICYSPLLHANTTVLYEGKPVGTPDAAQFFRVIHEHNVRGMFTAPTALRAIHREDPELKQAQQAGYNTDRLKYLFVAGEHCDDETRQWAISKFKVPVLDNWWQTETAHAITASCVGMGNSLDPPKDVSGFPVPGFNVKILREDGSEAERGELGRIVCRMPTPPGFMTDLFDATERFKSTYFKDYPGYYDTMDAGVMDEHGYVKVLAREDDVINVAGHRLSTSALEESVLEHPDVVDCAVVGVDDKLKGQVPVALFIKRQGCPKTDSEVSSELVSTVRSSLGPVAAFRLSAAVPGLPRTRSGKTARKTIADMAKGKKIKIPPTIEDPSVYKDVKKALESLNLGEAIQDPM